MAAGYAFLIEEVVAACLTRLRDQRVHPSFAGYLCVLHAANRAKSNVDLQPDFRRFFDYFYLVEDHPKDLPYIKPFVDTLPTVHNLWLNSNVAGSYAASSLRLNSPFRQVVEIKDGKYSLRKDHANLAFKHLLYEDQVSALDLAAFLYRDFGFNLEYMKEGDLIPLLSTFAIEFGFSDTFYGDSPKLSDAALTLFDWKALPVKQEPWFDWEER